MPASDPGREALLEKTAALLEYGRIREAAASCALSAEAAEIIRSEPPLFNAAAVRERKALVRAFRGLLAKAPPGGTDGANREFPAAGFLLPRLAVAGTILSLDEALALGLFIERGEALRRFILAGTDTASGPNVSVLDGTELRCLAESAPGCSDLAAAVFRIIDKDGNVRDLPEIKKIRSRIKEVSKDLEHIAGRYNADENTRRMLQSALPSQRDGRLVLAVKANFRGRIKGIVHEVSATGQTIFVEPEESVERNNQLLMEKAALDEAIRRLLRELTAVLAERRSDVEDFHRVIVYLDSLRARARHALETGGIFAEDVPEEFAFADAIATEKTAPGFILKAARHPLLGRDAVPIDLALNPQTTMVVITGPNTGGKTAALKTAGLFALMNQSGLALPAAAAALPIFDGVYADIGDEQSLSQSLSTFSAHMTTIAGILHHAGSRSLVLLDELGAGTDPEEGSAIAMAILDHLIEASSLVILTTHHGILKNYGYSRPGVENASAEFDPRTLSPTYRIIMGIPGESRALDIAGRNGFPPPLVERARSYLDKERADVSALITGLKEKHRELDEASRSAEEAGRRLREEQRKADLRELTLRQREQILKEEGAGNFRRFLVESRKTLENLVREIREGEMTGEKTRKVKAFIRELETVSAALDAEAAGDGTAVLADAALAETALTEAAAGKDPRPIKAGRLPAQSQAAFAPGMEVLAGPSRRRGRIVREEKNHTWVVETGSVKMSFSANELVPASPSRPSGSTGASAAGWTAELAPAETAKPELKLLGMRLPEALELLRRQIDAALISGLESFAVVHGKGDGILQRGVQEFLAADPAVADFAFSRPELGGTGRTEVWLQTAMNGGLLTVARG